MGTNYYFTKGTAAPRHVGKSSAGWCFALRVYPGEINSLADWMRIWCARDGVLRDEYERQLTPAAMFEEITLRDWRVPLPKEYMSFEHFCQRNFAVPGPRGLARHAIGGCCIGHGRGSWDLLTGDFC